MKKQDKGFTLVELLIVIVILGILATVTVFAVRGITDQGQESACEADLKTVQTATESFFAAYGGDTIPTVDGDGNPVGGFEGTASYQQAVDDGDIAAPGTSAEVTLQNAELLVSPSGNYDLGTDGAIAVDASSNDCLAFVP